MANYVLLVIYIFRFVFDYYLSVIMFMMLNEYIMVIWDELSLERVKLNS